MPDSHPSDQAPPSSTSGSAWTYGDS